MTRWKNSDETNSSGRKWKKKKRNKQFKDFAGHHVHWYSPDWKRCHFRSKYGISTTKSKWTVTKIAKCFTKNSNYFRKINWPNILITTFKYFIIKMKIFIKCSLFLKYYNYDLSSTLNKEKKVLAKNYSDLFYKYFQTLSLIWRITLILLGFHIEMLVTNIIRTSECVMWRHHLYYLMGLVNCIVHW